MTGSHGTIRLIEPACTSCMICARECPTWCIHIDSHTERIPDLPPGVRERTRNVLDRFALDWSLCMYCGICIEECPFDALEWVDPPTAAGIDLVEEMVASPDSPIRAGEREAQASAGAGDGASEVDRRSSNPKPASTAASIR